MTKEELVTENRSIVTPGETIAKGMGFVPGHGTYREGDEVRAGKLGMVSINGKVIRLIALSGRYIPKKNDKIIAKVTDILMSGWMTDFGSAYNAVMNVRDATSEFIPRGADLSQYFTIGDYIFTQITNVTSQNAVDITMKGPGLRKFKGGRILSVNCHKVPRVIGKEGSMVSQIKNATGCQIYVGQNGIVWINGEPAKENIAVDIINYIADNAHRPGLTDIVSKMLEDKLK